MPVANIKSSLCRTCLATLPKVNVYNIYNTLDLANKLELCSGLPVKSTDEYPENVCNKCHEQIGMFYKFQQMCRISLDSFQKLLETFKATRERTSESTTNPECLELTNSVREKTIAPLENVKKKKARRQKKRWEYKIPEKKVVIKRWRRAVVLKQTVDNSPLSAESKVEEKSEENVKVESVTVDEEFLDEEFCGNLNSKEVQEYVHLKDENISADEDEEFLDEKFSDGLKTKETKECDITLKSSTDLPEITTTQSFQCDRCCKKLPSLARLQTHQKRHEQIFKCDVDGCLRLLKNESNLRTHKRKYHPLGTTIQRHMCEICGKRLKTLEQLRDHKFTHFDKTGKPYVCDEKGCGKRFATKRNFTCHKKRHSAIKKHVCPYCGKRTVTRYELGIHINYHTLEKAYPCSLCSKVFKSVVNMKYHLKVHHEGIRNFGCRYCEKTYATGTSRMEHERTHTGEKPKVCNECGSRFARAAVLRYHMRMHLREKGLLPMNPKS